MESSSTVLLGVDPIHLHQELHALLQLDTWSNPAFHEEQPANMLPNSAFGLALPFNFVGSGIPQHALTDVDSSSWIDKKLSHVLSHGLSKDSSALLLSNNPKPLLSHGQIPKESCVEQMMATIRNGDANEVVSAKPNMDMAQILHKFGSFTHNASPTVNPSKGGPSIHQDAHIWALSMDPEFARKATNLSCPSKQARFSSSSQLTEVAANPLRGDGGKLDSSLIGLSQAGSQDNLMGISSGLDTLDKPLCMGTNIPQIGLQGIVKQTVMVSPNAHAISTIKEEPLIMNKSDESFGQEASSLCERIGGCETTTARINKGKKKRVKDRSKDDAPVKDTGTGEVKKGKRYKTGGDTSEEDQWVDSGDSTPSSGKESSKPPEPLKLDYIHVRARRGQATDSHSLAERVRREKISKRMKFLQDLVPGCRKVTAKALMLDEIINYVQSLQRQVEFLSMKLASVSPMLDCHMDGLFGSDIIQPQAIQHQALMMSGENPTSYSPYLHVHAPQQTVSPCPLVNVHSLRGSDMAARQTMSTSLASMDSDGGDAVSQVRVGHEGEAWSKGCDT